MQERPKKHARIYVHIACIAVAFLASSCSTFRGSSESSGSASDAGSDAGESDAGEAEGGVDASGAPLDAYAQLILSDNPVAYFRLDETSGAPQNLAPTSLEAQYGSDVARGVPGLLANNADTAAGFDGNTGASYLITVAPNSALQPKNALTLECWLRAVTPTSGAQVLIEYDEKPATDYQSYALQLNAGKPEFYATKLFYDAPVATTPIDTGIHYLVFTYDGQTGILYVDGVSVASLLSSGSFTYDESPTNGLVIGGDVMQNLTFNGTLDEVAIYASALSAAQIAAHYAAGH